VSLRCLAAAPERGAPDVAFLADSDVVSGVDEGSAGGWRAASGLREEHPGTIVKTETTKTVKSVHLKEPISSVARAVGSIRELPRWPNCCRGGAAFTGGP
jgi:hypothetical protein